MKLKRFPSPCGVSIVANTGFNKSAEMFAKVSVPLRGKYRGESKWSFWYYNRYINKFPSPCGVSIVANMEKKTLNSLLKYWVSVPLRGKYRGESKDQLDFLSNFLVEFPSPCGVSIVANLYDHLKTYQMQPVRFRPLAG